jgi:transposase-like protein
MVVGVFPNPASVERLLGSVLMEQDEEWQAGDRCYLALDPEPLESPQRAAIAAAAQ